MQPHDDTSSSPLSLWMLGPFRVMLGATTLALPPRSRAHALLAYLLLHHGRAVDRSYLVGQLDPDLPDLVARRRLSDTIYLLRRLLPAARLQTTPTTLALTLAPQDDCDLLAFEHLLRQPVDQVERSLLLACPEPIFCPELDHEWVLPARETLHLRLLNRLEQCASVDLQAGQLTSARDLLLRLLQLDPLREVAEVSLLHVFEALGSRSEAIRQYEQWCQHLQREFGFTPRPETEQAYRYLIRQTTPALRPTPTTLPTTLPLVGRDDERRHILNWMDQASSHATLILLEGMAGIGKSYLLDYVAGDAHWRNWQVARATTDPTRSTLEQALASLLTPLHYEHLAAILPAAWYHHVIALFPPDDACRLASQSTRHAELSAESYYATIVRLLEGLTSHTPLLLILDGMHEASEADLALLSRLATMQTRCPLMLIVSYRPSAREEGGRWAALQRLGTLATGRCLELASLNGAACRMLLEETLGPWTDAAVEQIVSFTGGHPLFLREVVTWLLEDGLLRRERDGRWMLDGGLFELEPVPDLAHTVGLRLDSLTERELTLLTLMALQHEPLSVEALVQLTDWSAPSIIEQAQRMVQRHIVRQCPSGYTYAHALIAQAARERLDATSRRTYHDRLLALPDKHIRPSPLRRALHALAAESWEAALPLLITASKEARRRGDYRVALRLIKHALDALAQSNLTSALHTEYHIELLFEQLQVWNWHPPEQAEEQAAVIATLNGYLPARGPFRLQLTLAEIEYLLTLGANQAALTKIRTALDQLSNDATPEQLVRLHFQYGKVAQRLEMLHEGIAHLKIARDLAAACGSIEDEVAALGNLAVYHHFAGDFGTARVGYNQVKAFCDTHGLVMPGLVASANLAALDQAEGKLAEAICGYEQVIASCARNAAVDPPDLENLAELMILVGAFDRAKSLLSQAIALWHERGGNAALTHCRQAMLALATQEFACARDHLAIARASNRTGDDRRVAGEIELWQALIGLEVGDFALAEASVAHAERIYRHMGVRFYQALITAIAALAAARQGHFAQAHAHLAASTAALEARVQTLVDPRYYLGLTAELLGETGEAARFYQTAWEQLCTQAATLPPDLAAGMPTTPFAKRLARAVARQQAQTALMTLPGKYAPTGRPLHPWEEVRLVWSLPDTTDERHNRTVRQRNLHDLLIQASEQEAAPTLADLARMLQVSTATVSRDLLELRRRGASVATRGVRR
ncbi:ATP-binding protein [Candidatus Chloroploca asiatica]|nr:AAA family ATPase [Candidatus Chloroploca asiatica]